MRLATFMPGFTDELEKISQSKQANLGSTIGALGGAALGSMGPGTKRLGLKRRIAGGAAGAALGGLAGGALGKAKKSIWNDTQHREHESLYNYTPSVDQGGTVWGG